MNEGSAREVLERELAELTDVLREVGPVPLDTFFKEAAALAHTVSLPEVRERLLAVGLEPEKIDRLPLALIVAQEAQAAWVSVKGRSYSNALVDLIAQAHKERSDILAAARFHLRSDRIVLETLNAIAEGEGLADLVQDLFALWHLVEQHAPAFERDKTFDAPVRARTARELAERLQQTQTQEQFDVLQHKLREQRDRSYTYLSRLVHEIRQTGRYAFRNDPALVGRFSSAYWVAQGRKKRRAAQGAQAGSPEPAAAEPATAEPAAS